jgi:hypothetical protein
MSHRLPRIGAALCGIVGTVLLGIYFLAAPPLPPADASAAQVASAATQYQTTWFLGAWIQATGSLLSVVFYLALVHLAGGMSRLAGTLTLLGSAVLLTVALVEGVFTIGFAQAAAAGHPDASLTSYLLMGVFIHIFPLVPAPLIYLSLGVVLLGSSVLPRVFGSLAIALGVAFGIVGFVGLFTTPILTLVVLGLQSAWVLTAALALLVRPGRPASAS